MWMVTVGAETKRCPHGHPGCWQSLQPPRSKSMYPTTNARQQSAWQYNRQACPKKNGSLHASHPYLYRKFADDTLFYFLSFGIGLPSNASPGLSI